MSQDKGEVLVSKLLPEEYKQLKNFPLIYGRASTKFGQVLAAMHEDKICYISFNDSDSTRMLSDLKNEFPSADLTEDNDKIEKEVENIFSEKPKKSVQVLLKGTEFETKVWENLLTLKRGSTFSYEDVAKAIGNPKAIRAVARAIAKNKVAYCVPCHRVISKSGGLSKYKWGAERKVKILKDEDAL